MTVISAVLAAMDKKLSKAQFLANVTQIVMKGSVIKVSFGFSRQDPSTNVFPQSIRSQFTTKILLGNANQGKKWHSVELPQLAILRTLEGITWQTDSQSNRKNSLRPDIFNMDDNMGVQKTLKEVSHDEINKAKNGLYRMMQQQANNHVGREKAGLYC